MFVGAEAYEAAGGTITRDLFSGDDDGFMDDAALVHRLAIEKLEAKAAELRPQWAWTKAVLDLEYGALSQYGRLRPQPAEASRPSSPRRSSASSSGSASSKRSAPTSGPTSSRRSSAARGTPRRNRRDDRRSCGLWRDGPRPRRLHRHDR